MTILESIGPSDDVSTLTPKFVTPSLAGATESPSRPEDSGHAEPEEPFLLVDRRRCGRKVAKSI